MARRLASALILLPALLAGAPSARAQAGSDRVRISVEGGIPLASAGFSQAFTRTVNLETARFTTDLSPNASGFAGAGARIRIARAFSAGLTMTVASGSANGSLDAVVPHPFYFNQPRSFVGDIDGLDRRETAVHLELGWTVPMWRKAALSLFGGPSRIALRQALATRVNYDEAFPFDTATYASADSTVVTSAALGFHAGADITWRLGARVGVAGLVRYSRAPVSLSAGAGNDVDTVAGGVQAGGGLRLFF